MPNSMASAYSSPPSAVSKQDHCIAGILTTVYGLNELPPETRDLACLWLLHPRLQTQSCMEPIASSTIRKWNEQQQQSKRKGAAIGLIAVAFDQRNHGSREVDPLANQTWRAGNKRHAQDMFASYHGTALDTSQLLTYISSYIFPMSEKSIVNNMVLGMSLGGHAAWHCIMHDPRITTAIVVIGCPDYVRLMVDRASRSKLETWTESAPPGSAFLESSDFPRGLIEAVEKYDPAGLLLGDVTSRDDLTYLQDPTGVEKERITHVMRGSLQGKRILNMSGSADKLVPYRCGEMFLRWLKKAIAPNGWFSDGNVLLEDIVFDGVGHEMSSGMVEEVHRFVIEGLEQSAAEAYGKASKI